MLRILGKFLLLMLLVLPSSIMFAGNGGSLLVQADDSDIPLDDIGEDLVEGEDEGDVTVEEDDRVADTIDTAAAETETEKEEEEEEEKPLKPSPYGDTHILFTKPTGTDFPAGDMVGFLVGFHNKGEKDFTVETIDASFRYPQDYSFYIQNFTVTKYDRVVESQREATFEYVFTPSETFSARAFGLTINLNYKDSEGNIFQDAVFNETINIIESDEGLDGETFFLYVFLAAVLVLLLVGVQQLLASFGVKKRMPKLKLPIEMGTQSKSDVDFDWLPKETLQDMNKSPRRSPKQSSPGRRRTKRTTGGAED